MPNILFKIFFSFLFFTLITFKSLAGDNALLELKLNNHFIKHSAFSSEAHPIEEKFPEKDLEKISAHIVNITHINDLFGKNVEELSEKRKKISVLEKKIKKQETIRTNALLEQLSPTNSQKASQTADNALCSNKAYKKQIEKIKREIEDAYKNIKILTRKYEDNLEYNRIKIGKFKSYCENNSSNEIERDIFDQLINTEKLFRKLQLDSQ